MREIRDALDQRCWESHAKQTVTSSSANEIIESLNANLLGPLLMSRAAIDLATEKPTNKKMTIWQFGFSQFGANLSKSAATHKSTKTGLSQLTKSLNEEMQRENIDNVFVRQMSPGLALTTLLLKDASPISKKIFNALAEEPEVSPNISPKRC